MLRFTWRTFAAGSEIAMSSVMVTVPSRLYPRGGQLRFDSGLVEINPLVAGG